MAELNLKQIIDRLNAEFTGETRKLVFWYDDKAEFAEDMETVELQNAKIYHLQPDNQFYTKYFLERVDKTTNYLIYAPFPKPDVRDNHLEDTMLYSRRFFADRASLLSVDLGIEEKYKPVIEKHIKFFANKERTQRFYDLEIENFNEENILVGLLSAVCKARTCSFEEVVRIVLTDGELVDNAFLQEFEKYDLLSAFWQLCEQHFGYTDTKPSLERLLVTLFVTYTGRYVQAELPAAWRSFVSYKSGNIIAFLDSLMNSVLYRDKYDALSAHVAKGLNVFSAFAGMRVDDLVECDTFLAVDQVLVKWLISRLVSEDIGAIVNGFTIPELCEKRAKMHFGRKTGKTYQLLSSAYSMVKEADYHAVDGLKPIIDRYLAADYNMDQQYRKFYYYYDQLESTESFEPTDKDHYDSSFSCKTTDPEMNMLSVGDKICEQLDKAGVAYIHDTLVHDYPSYDGSYDSSRMAVKQILEEYPSIKVCLDVHRDGIEREDGTRLAPVAEIEGREAAQLMIISGCDDGTMGMPDYMKNFHFACALQSALESDWQGLTRPVLFDYRHYNQDLTTGSLLIEVGSHGNSITQAQYTGELIGKTLGEMFGGE